MASRTDVKMRLPRPHLSQQHKLTYGSSSTCLLIHPDDCDILSAVLPITIVSGAALLSTHPTCCNAVSPEPHVITMLLCNDRALYLRPKSCWPKRSLFLPLSQAPPHHGSEYDDGKDAESDCKPYRTFLAMTRSTSPASSRLQSVRSFACTATVRTSFPGLR